MNAQLAIAAARTAFAPSAVRAPAESSWGSGLAIAATLLLMMGCVAGVGVGWWYLAERRRIQRCRQQVPSRPTPETPQTTVGSSLASQGVEHIVARSRSPRHVVGRRRAVDDSGTPTSGAPLT